MIKQSLFPLIEATDQANWRWMDHDDENERNGSDRESWLLGHT